MRDAVGRGRLGQVHRGAARGAFVTRVAERYYIHVTEPHVTTGFERFVTYLEKQLVDSVPAVTERVQ